MMIFSKIHDWQGNDAVKQILVFPSEDAERQFQILFAEKVAEHGIEDASDTNLGACYKLRAVKNSDGRYVGLIRCGATGFLIAEDSRSYEGYHTALAVALELLQATIHFPSFADVLKVES